MICVLIQGNQDLAIVRDGAQANRWIELRITRESKVAVWIGRIGPQMAVGAGEAIRISIRSNSDGLVAVIDLRGYRPWWPSVGRQIEQLHGAIGKFAANERIAVCRKLEKMIELMRREDSLRSAVPIQVAYFTLSATMVQEQVLPIER